MYGSPPASSKDLSIPFSSFKESEHQHRQQQMSSGLLRYRSAPSSLFGDVCEDFLPVRPSSPETENIFARFLAATPDLREKQQEQPLPPVSTAMEQRRDFPDAQQQQQGMMFQGQHQQQQMPTHVSMAMETEQMKSSGVGAGAPNLIRQSSSPAGLFSHLNVENGYGMIRGMGGFRNGEAVIPPAASRLKGQISFSSRQSSIMSQISEMGSEGSSPEDSSLASGSSRGFIPGYPVGSWDDSSMLSDTYSGLKRPTEADGSKFVPVLNQTDPQNGELRSNASGLNSSDMAAIDKFLQFQDSVPCKIRAKRGCATHPRSIAERVRRTRISERMRKLQELVPNMDKQTNTADMLDLAVEYIKDLQKQAKGISDSRGSCTCPSSKRKHSSV